MDEKSTGLILSTLIVMIVTISGCITFGGVKTTSQGVIIENFEVDFPKVYAEEKFQLQMKIRNMGSVDAGNVYPKLYNTETSVQGNKLQISCDETCQGGITLLAPDPDMAIEGESKTCIWDCKAPSNIPKGLSVTFNPSVRLYYFYETHTTKSITIASQNELRSLQTQGKTLPSETASTTEGPVQLDVVVNGPIRYEEDEKRVKFPININIQNTGGGITCMDLNYIQLPIPIPYLPGSGFISTIVGGCENPGYWNKVELYFDKKGENNIGEQDETNINCSSVEGSLMQGHIVDLWKGQSATLTCEMDVPLPEQYSSLMQKNLKFSIYYAYFTDSAVSIEVVGRAAQ